MARRSADLAIVGGTVVTEGWAGKAAVLVRGERIAGIVADEEASGLASRVIDAEGQVVLPGGVDPHCHVALPLGAYTTKDSFWSASIAALAGGTTTIVDFAIPRVGQHPLDVFEERLVLAKTSRCDYAFHGCVSAPDVGITETIHELAARGARTVKVFTTYRDLLMVGTETIAQVMSALRDVAGLTYVHAEANDLVESAQREAEHEGEIGARVHARTRPPESENAAVAEVLDVARRTSAPVYFVHQSTASAVDLVVDARRAGVAAFSESCPHYLALDDACYAGSHPERFVCCPPLRDEETRRALASRMQMGFLHTIGSDHCCYDAGQKRERADDVREMPNGLPGVETRLPVIFSKFVATGVIGLREFAALTAGNPARLNGLYPRKGVLAPGSDADIVVLDPRAIRTVHASDLHMETDYSPYDGAELTGWPTTVVSRGRVVLADRELVDPGPEGEYLSATEIAV